MIYFLKRTDGAIKVGTTIDFERRLGEHVKMHGELQLLGICDGDRSKEQELINQFSEFLIEGREWFASESPIVDYISANTTLVVPKPESVRQRVSLTIHPSIHAVLSFIRARHMATMGERLTMDEILWQLFLDAAPEAVEAVLAMGAEIPTDDRKSKNRGIN